MNTEQLVRIVIENLRPNMAEYADDRKFHYWMEYDFAALGLMEILEIQGITGLVKQVNSMMSRYFSLDEKHHCATDVAETLLSLCPEEFTGKFVFN